MNEDTDSVKAVDEARKLNAEVRGYVQTAKTVTAFLWTMASMLMLAGGVASLILTHGRAGDVFVVAGALGLSKAVKF